MKAVIITLTPEEKKAIQPIVDKLRRGRVMMEEGSDIVAKFEKKLWETLNDLHPIKNGIDKSYEYENGKIR